MISPAFVWERWTLVSSGSATLSVALVASLTADLEGDALADEHSESATNHSYGETRLEMLVQGNV